MSPPLFEEEGPAEVDEPVTAQTADAAAPVEATASLHDPTQEEDDDEAEDEDESNEEARLDLLKELKSQPSLLLDKETLNAKENSVEHIEKEPSVEEEAPYG